MITPHRPIKHFEITLNEEGEKCVIALCEDGTMWLFGLFKSRTWQQLEGPPVAKPK